MVRNGRLRLILISSSKPQLVTSSPTPPVTPFARDPLLRAAVVAPGIHVSPSARVTARCPPLPPLSQVTPQPPKETTKRWPPLRLL